MKILDTKLKNIRNGDYKPSDFIIADAKDADMGGGRRAPGFIREENGKLTEKPASYESYLNKMKEIAPNLKYVVLRSQYLKNTDKIIFKSEDLNILKID